MVTDHLVKTRQCVLSVFSDKGSVSGILRSVLIWPGNFAFFLLEKTRKLTVLFLQGDWLAT